LFWSSSIEFINESYFLKLVLFPSGEEYEKENLLYSALGWSYTYSKTMKSSKSLKFNLRRWLFIIEWSLKRAVLWAITPYSSENTWCFGGTYCLYLQSRRVSQGGNQQNEAASWNLIHQGFQPLPW
jgi:hypothetical protein